MLRFTTSLDASAKVRYHTVDTCRSRWKPAIAHMSGSKFRCLQDLHRASIARPKKGEAWRCLLEKSSQRTTVRKQQETSRNKAHMAKDPSSLASLFLLPTCCGRRCRRHVTQMSRKRLMMVTTPSVKESQSHVRPMGPIPRCVQAHHAWTPRRACTWANGSRPS